MRGWLRFASILLPAAVCCSRAVGDGGGGSGEPPAPMVSENRIDVCGRGAPRRRERRRDDLGFDRKGRCQPDDRGARDRHRTRLRSS